MCRLAFDAARCRPLSCLPPLPSLALRAAAARRCCARAASAPANAATAIGRARSRQDACIVGRLRRRQREVRCECTRTARATTRRRPAERHARWHDKMHGNVQRVGGHHGRDSSQTGCATPITADALTGRNTGCRTTPGWSHSRGTVRRIRGGGIAAGWQRPAPAVGRQHGGRRHAVDADDAASAAQLLRRDGAHALSSGTRAGR